MSGRGKRRAPPPAAASATTSARTSRIRSAESPRSMTENPSPRPTPLPWRRSTRWAMAWNVPACTCAARAGSVTAPTRRSMSWAARRLKVTSRIRSGGVPRASRRPRRATRVAVLPVPAPAMITSGPPSWSTASRCRASRPSAHGAASPPSPRPPQASWPAGVPPGFPGACCTSQLYQLRANKCSPSAPEARTASLRGRGPTAVHCCAMEIVCADCGCLVDRGVRVTVCAVGPDCCCQDLPIRAKDQR